MARISDITIIAYALVAVAGALWKKELRAGYRWLTAKALALRSEVRAFVAWVFMPDPLEGLTTIDAEDIESIEYNYRGSRDLDISSPDVPQDDPWCTTPGEPTRWPDEPPAKPVKCIRRECVRPVTAGAFCDEHNPAPKRPKRKRRPKKGGK